MSRRRIALVAVAGMVLVVAGVAAYVVWPRSANEISAEEAVAAYRSEADDGGDTAGAAGLPEAGVYVFAAEGEEQVRLGPLPTQTRTFPETVTAVVTLAGEGCFDWRLNLFEEHTEDTRWCVEQELRLDDHRKDQRIGALSPTAAMTCDPAEVTAPSGDPVELACRLTLDGGPASVTADLAGPATTGAEEPITVDGEEVPATPVTIELALSGDLSGSWVETTWWSADHLPLRIERDLDLRGVATFRETSRLDLTSLDPQR